MSIEDVRGNYNSVGIRVMEQMYTDNYLSIGGKDSTEALAHAAGVTADTHVLDVGCGIGGPSLHLAATFGCRVTGLDLIDVSVAQATERARSKGLERLTDFHEGDATAMPFDDASFDLVWGQDAWCHVVDKSRLIAECVRVLVAGGTIAFTDWLVTGEMARSDREDLLSAAASETMETFDGYRALLIDHGFSIVDEADVSATFVEQFDAIMADLETLQASISSQFSPRVYDIVLEKNGIIAEAFRSGAMGGGRFIAKKL